MDRVTCTLCYESYPVGAEHKHAANLLEILREQADCGIADECSNEEIDRAGLFDEAADEVQRFRSVVSQLQVLHDQWGETGNHFEAFKALRTILNGVEKHG